MKKLIFILILFSVSLAGVTQTFEEFKKQRKQELNQMKKEQQEALKALKQEYDNYIEERDKEFADYLENEWKAFNLYKAERRLPEPKPKDIPSFDPDQLIVTPEDQDTPEERKTEKEPPKEKPTPDIPLKNIDPIETIVIDAPKSKPEDIRPVVQKSVPQNFRHDIVNFNFYGKDIAFEIDPKLRRFRVSSINEGSLSNAWSTLSNYEASAAIHQAEEYREEMNLNDWALLKMIEELSDELTGTENEKLIMTWFLMNRYGYNVRIAYAKDKVSLLVPATTQLYGVKYLILEGKKYFILNDLNSDQIYTYESPYPLAQKDIDLHIHKPLLLGSDLTERKLTFTHAGESFSIPVVYNRSHVDFYNDYPITEIEVYLNAPVSEALKSSLNAGLKKKVVGMNNPDAVNYLLSLVQKSFKYKTDPEQFGHEKFFFPEEVFHYPFSDCEDRSAIFSYLVRELKGIEVVGLDYPGHLATAVKLPEAMGSFVMVGRDRYIVADPTYINAPYGLVMPQFSNSTVKVVRVKPGELFLARKFWNIAHEAGAYRGGVLQDYAFTGDGGCYLAGYYTGKLNFGRHILTGNEQKQAFVARFNTNGEVTWLTGMDSEGEDAFAYANALTLVDGKPVVSGVFRGGLKTGRLREQSKNNSWFVSMVSENRGTEWLNNVPIKEDLNNQRLVSMFSGTGRSLETKYYAAEDVLNTMEGLSYLDGSIVLNGYLAAVPGTSDKSYASNAEMDYAELLKAKNDELILENVNEAIAGLFAVTSLIQTSGYIIPGAEAQKALDKYNPSFKKKSPSIYESIGTIEFLKNSEGIVTIKSENKHVTIDKVRINNNARLKVVPLPDGNHRIDVLSGIEVGKYFVWYDLNYVKMLRETGDLLFDYDDDHTHKVFNLKKDILY